MVDMTEMILPPPSAPFGWEHRDANPSLVCREVERFARHLFTTRLWALGARAASAESEEGWREVAEAIGVTPDRLIRLRQVHGNSAVMAAPASHLAAADIVVTDDPTLAIAVQSADCVPLLFADPATGAVAAAHAGWRGMAARAPEAAVNALARAFGSRAENLVVALGPSIGACCYEVGIEVNVAFTRADFSSADIERWFQVLPRRMPGNASLPSLASGPRHDRWFFDGWAAVRDQLEAAGVRPGHVLASELCTASHPAVLCSYRRDGSPAGRMAAVITPRPGRS